MKCNSTVGQQLRSIGLRVVLRVMLPVSLASACSRAEKATSIVDAATIDRLPRTDFEHLPQRVLQVSEHVDNAYRVRGGVLLDNGSIALAVGGQNRVLVFTPDGQLRDSIGRSGAGPGEFRSVSRIFRAGDGIGVFDAITRRVTWIRDGRIVGVTPLLPGGDAIGVAPQAIGALGMWRAVVVTRFVAPAKPGMSHDTLALGVVDSLGHITLTGARVRGPDQFVGDPKDGMRALGMSPFARTSVFGVCASSVLWSMNDTIDVRRLRSDTTSAESVVRIAFATQPLDDARLRTQLTQAMGPSAGTPTDVTPEAMRMLREMTTATALPQLADMFCATDGTLTLRQFRDPLAERGHLVQVDTSGAPVLTFAFPAWTRVLDVTATSALIVSIGADDLPVVAVVSWRRP